MLSLQSLYNIATVPNTYGNEIYSPATVYYIKLIFPHITLYKIGFTRCTVEERAKHFKVASEVIIELIDSIKNTAI